MSGEDGARVGGEAGAKAGLKFGLKVNILPAPLSLTQSGLSTYFMPEIFYLISVCVKYKYYAVANYFRIKLKYK